MSKYKFLIIILMFMKFLYYSEAVNFKDIFEVNETNEEFKAKMNQRNLPLVGEPYVQYLKRHQELDDLPLVGEPYVQYLKRHQELDENSFHAISEDEYQILMSSIPRINESMESVNKRNKETKKDLQIYTNEVFKSLKSRYPQIYETYEEYTDRMNILKIEPLIEELFKGLKNHCPNLGEIYDEYIEIRRENYNIIGISESDYVKFLNSYPMLLESETVFINRIINRIYLDTENSSDYYKGMRSLFPIFAETYSEYSDRMEKKWLVPMKLRSFIIFQAYYPNLQVQYNNFYDTMTIFNQICFGRIWSLKIPIYSEEVFNLLKSKFPKPFESQTDFNNRMLEEDLEETIDEHDYFLQVYNRDFAKRMYPKMSETYKEYQDRIKSIFFPDQTEISAEQYNYYKSLCLKPLSEIYFREFKKNYPQFNQLHEDILYLDSDVSLVNKHDYVQLVNSLPGVFETYPHYNQRMSNQSINGIDEEEFNDLKRIYIKQCETYADYEIRMQNLQIKPMSIDNAFKLKITVPRELEISDDTYSKLLEDSQKQILKYEDDPIIDLHDSAPYTEKQQVVVFSKTRHTIFKLIHPCAFENYESYKTRINVIQKEYDLENTDSRECEFSKSLIQPLTEEEFMDLKLRFPKLSETHDDYLNRFLTYGFDKKIEAYTMYEQPLRRYNIKIMILNTSHIQLFNIFKHAQIQPEDNPDSYKERYKKLALNKSVLLKKMHSPLREDYCDFVSFLESLDKNDYEDIMNVFPKYYDTFQEYNDLMKDRGLQPLSYDYFKMLKSAFPHLLDNNFNEYISRIQNTINFPKNILIMTQDQFDQFKFRIPKRFETTEDYKKRIADASMDSYTPDDIERLKRIYPKVCSTFSEFWKTMNDLGMSMTTKTFNFYKSQFPNRNEKDYEKYLARLNSAKSIPMSKEEFDLLNSRFPKAPERYFSYEQRLQLLSIEPLDSYDFYDLKNLFSISHETYNEHYKRLFSNFREPLSLDEFKKEKSLRVLIGETFMDHFKRIIDIYYQSEENPYTQANGTTLSNNYGIETITDMENFVHHMIMYPFPYDTFDNYCERQYAIISEIEYDPNSTTTIWYNQMKKLLPRFNESIEIYRNRTKELEFPEITVKQFNRYKLEMPQPAETYSIYNSRTIAMVSTYNYLGKIKKQLYDTFISVSPNFYINYEKYVEKVKSSGYEPLSQDEFIAFKECLPKLQDSFLKFNENIKLMGLATIKLIDFNKLKIFYPRIHHISYDDYILDIELKYAKNRYREQIIDALKLSSDEFTDYKRKLPRQFEWSYETYQNRMKTEGISEILTMDDFYGARLANFPLADEDYEKYQEKMDSLNIDPIPSDVFNFLKRIYPDLFENRYEYRIKNIVYKVLKPPDYTENKYKSNMDNDIISKIIKRSKPYEKLEEKIKNLSTQMMTSKEFIWLKLNFPTSLYTYIIYKAKAIITILSSSTSTPNNNIGYMDEITHNSFKKAYFTSLNETYEEYETRMKSLKLIAFPRYIFRYCKAIYPHPFQSHQSYLDSVALYKIIELRNIKDSFASDFMTKWDWNSIPQETYIKFQAFFPRAFDTSINVDEHHLNLSILNNGEIDLIKLSYFPRLAENYDTYKERMIKLGLGVMNTDLFTSFKTIYPNPITATSYSKYKELFQTISDNIFGDEKLNIRHIMTEEEFNNSIPHDFPKLFESWNTFCEERLILNSQTSRLINDRGAFSENLFNDMKTVFYPILGQNCVYYLKFIQSLSISDIPSWNGYFKNVISLYPKFFENIDNYNERLQDNQLKYLKLDANQFNIFFQIFPFPYESYLKYKIRNTDAPLTLSEKEFSYYQQVFPQISESYSRYSFRLKSEIDYDSVMLLQLFKLYKKLLPQIDESYNKYNDRFVAELKKISDKETKNQLSFFVKHKMYFNDMHYKKSGPAMTYDEFKLFKESLPMPEEFREDYIHRINKLADIAKENDKIPPEILPLELFINLKKIYPNKSNTNYKVYLNNMENIEVTPVSENTFNSLVEVAKSMALNRYTVYEKSFTDLINTKMSK